MSGDEETCPCGRPLHYPSADVRMLVEILSADLGPTITVTTPDGTWEVPRHYLALHGIKGWELPEVAARYGFRRVERPT